ncbi:hypothetical protein [Pseudobutyrivibrio sp. ACV-2]|uniref:hypothetical protein n=1 Tax=Pseudobutyrivibrio sp. ACV-2 TaxID=1520801 RepID=UPI00111531BF|nr:hypothetical protein [Pseudobutyrivibrio sp. ACV-2]
MSAYNKSELISQNGADFNSNFEMFPDSIKEFADGQYVSKMNLDTDDSFEYTILRIKYSEDDYNAELERLSNMGDAKSEVGSGNLIYDDKSYNYPAYIAKDGEDNVYEYVLNNENEREIIYVILSNPIVSEMKEWYEYLKIDRNSYEK